MVLQYNKRDLPAALPVQLDAPGAEPRRRPGSRRPPKAAA